MSSNRQEEANATPRTPLSRRLLFVGIALLFSLLLCEGVLQVAALVSPRVRYHLTPRHTRIKLDDEERGYRMSPYFSEHDAWGYRNESVPEGCDVLAVGDSLTYGYAAVPADSWPHQIERLGGGKVYNAGVGGYGPHEYEIVLRETLALNPKKVVVGLYVGNDFGEAYSSVYLDRWKGTERWRTTDADKLREFARLDEEKNLPELVAAFEPSRPEPEPANPVRLFFSNYSRLFGLVREIRASVQGDRTLFLSAGADPDADAFTVCSNKPNRVPWDEKPEFRTVFLKPERNRLSFDLSDPRMREGLRVTTMILASMNKTVSDAGREFVVVVLPTKTRSYAEIIGDGASPGMRKNVELETRITNELTAFLAKNKIRYVEALPHLRDCFTRGVPPYHQSDDTHPNGRAYGEIAKAAYGELSK